MFSVLQTEITELSISVDEPDAAVDTISKTKEGGANDCAHDAVRPREADSALRHAAGLRAQSQQARR